MKNLHTEMTLNVEENSKPSALKPQLDQLHPPCPVVHLPRPGNGKVVFVKDFVKKGQKCASEAVLAAVEACRQSGASRLEFSQEVYHFCADTVDPVENAHLVLRDLSDLEIVGNGAELIFEAPVWGVRFINCRRLLLRDLVMDWKVSLASPGVVEVRADGRTTIRIPDAFPLAGKQLARAVSEYDPERMRWVINGAEAYYPRDTVEIEPQVLYSPAFGELHHPPRGSLRLTDGMHVCVRHWVYEGGGFGFYGPGNQDLIFEDITVYQCPGHAFAGYNCERGVRLTRIRIERRPDSDNPVSVTADGAHFGAMLGDVIVEDCDFSHQGDDSINIHGTWLEIVSRPSDDVYELTSRWFSENLRLEPGDQLRFCRKENLAEFATAEILDSRVDYENQIVTVQLTQPLAVAVHDGGFVANMTRSCSNFLFRNNYFHDHRARGMLIQARNGVIENNRIENVMAAALQMTSDCNHWKEGFGCENVVVRGNTLKGCNYAVWERGPTGRHMAAVSLVADTRTGISDWPVHRNIVFEDNRVCDTPGLAFLIASVDNVLLRGNCIENANTQPWPGTGEEIGQRARGAAMVTEASRVRIEGNRISGGNPHEPGIYVNPETTRDIFIDDGLVSN